MLRLTISNHNEIEVVLFIEVHDPYLLLYISHSSFVLMIFLLFFMYVCPYLFPTVLKLLGLDLQHMKHLMLLWLTKLCPNFLIIIYFMMHMCKLSWATTPQQPLTPPPHQLWHRPYCRWRRISTAPSPSPSMVIITRLRSAGHCYMLCFVVLTDRECNCMHMVPTSRTTTGSWSVGTRWCSWGHAQATSCSSSWTRDLCNVASFCFLLNDKYANFKKHLLCKC
jgi:hypothetical protein